MNSNLGVVVSLYRSLFWGAGELGPNGIVESVILLSEASVLFRELPVLALACG